MTKEQVILAYEKKYGHIPDLLARIVTQIDFDFWLSKPNYPPLDRFAAWNETVEGYKFWIAVCDTLTMHQQGLTEATFNAVTSKYRIPVPPRDKAKGIIELAERKQVFEVLKTLVEQDFEDGGSRVVASNEISEMKVVKDFTRFVIEVPGALVNDVYLGRKRVILMVVDAAEYDKYDDL